MLAVVMSTLLSIQYLRALAALAVVWCHTYLQLEMMTGADPAVWFNGRSGVDLFFVVSGFIIWTTTFDRERSPVGFWSRRLFRIVPLYWLCTLTLVILLLSAPDLFNRPHLDFNHVIQSLLFIPHFDPFQPTEMYPLLEVGWTLNYEMFFYAIFGISLVFRPGWRVLMMAVVFASLLVLGVVVDTDNPILLAYSDPILLEFIAGLLIGYIYTSGCRLPSAVGYGLILVAILSFLGMKYALDVEAIDWRVLCWGLPASLLVAGAVTIERTANLPQIAGLHLLGNASYAIYLSHVFTLGAIAWLWTKLALFPSVPTSIFVTLAIIVSAVLGVLLHLGFEVPIARWQRTWRRYQRWSFATVRAPHGQFARR